MSDVIKLVTKEEAEAEAVAAERREAYDFRQQSIVRQLENATKLAKQGKCTGLALCMTLEDGYVYTSTPTYEANISGLIGAADRLKYVLHNTWDAMLNEQLPTDDEDEEDCS